MVHCEGVGLKFIRRYAELRVDQMGAIASFSMLRRAVIAAKRSFAKLDPPRSVETTSSLFVVECWSLFAFEYADTVC
tara:strand:+ start:36791 stop:37021 length:231 start_codon:yes stop_codon:yes gene_type:complete